MDQRMQIARLMELVVVAANLLTVMCQVAPRRAADKGPCWCGIIVPGGHTLTCEKLRGAAADFFQAVQTVGVMLVGPKASGR